MSTPRVAERPTASGVGPNPFPGPTALGPDDTLYGRDQVSAKLVTQLLAERIVLLFGPSGAGKTSLLQAQTLKDLRERYPDLVHLPTVRVNRGAERSRRSTGNRYADSMRQCLLGGARPDSTPADALPSQIEEAKLAELVGTCEAMVREAERVSGGAHHLLIFDQFEELLTLDATDVEQKQGFLLAIGEVLRAPHRRAIFTMREEYVPWLEPYRHLLPGRLASRIRLDFLTPEAAASALREPIAGAGGEIEGGAVKRIIKELRITRRLDPEGEQEPIEHPLVDPMYLQVVGHELWRDHRGCIKTDHVRGHEFGQRAVENFYADRVAKLAARCTTELVGREALGEASRPETSKVAERRLRDWFDEHLIYGGVRRQTQHGPLGRIPPADDPLMKGLLKTRLVVSVLRSDSTWYELAHDRLVAGITASNTAWRRQQRSKTEARALEWLAHGKPNYMLYTRKERRSADRQPHRALLEVEQEFIRASRNHHRRRMAVMLTVLLLAGTLAYFNYQQRAAEQRAQDAEANALAAEAVAENSAAEAEANAAEAARQQELATAQTRRAADAELASASDQAAAMREAARARSLALVGGATFTGLRSDDANLALLLAVEAVEAAKEVTDDPSVSRDARASLYERMNSMRLALSFGDTPALAAAYDARGGRVVTGHADGWLRAWDAVTGEELANAAARFAIGRAAEVVGIAVLPDGTAVAVHRNGTVRSWTGGLGSTIHRRGDDDQVVVTAAFDPAAGYVALADEGGDVVVWDLASDAELVRVRSRGPDVGLAVSADRLVVGDGDAVIEAYGLPSGAPVPAFAPHPDAESVSARRGGIGLAIGQGNIVYAASRDGRIWVYQPGGGEPTSIDGATRQATRILVQPDAGHIVAVSEDGAVHVWQATVAGGTLNYVSRAQFDASAGAVRDAALRDDGRRLLVAGDKAAPGEWATRLAGHDRAIRDLTFSPDGRTIVTGGLDGALHAWTASGEHVERIVGEHEGGAYDVAFSPDGRWLVSVGSDGVILAREDGEPALRLVVEEPVYGADISPAGVLGTASGDGQVRLWDLETGALIDLLGDPGPPLNAVAFSGDGALLAAGGDGGALRVWDPASGELLAELEGHSDSVVSVAFAVDGTLASGSFDTTARLWRPRDDGSWVGEITGEHFSPVYEVGWFGSGVLLTASGDLRPSVQVWDVEAGERIAEIPHPMPTYAADLSRGGLRVAAAGATLDGLARPLVSPLDFVVLEAEAQRRIGRELSEDECNRYLGPKFCADR